jgi:hypothetical protein
MTDVPASFRHHVATVDDARICRIDGCFGDVVSA